MQTISFILVWLFIILSIRLIFDMRKWKSESIKVDILYLLDKNGFESEYKKKEEILANMPCIFHTLIVVLVLVAISRIFLVLTN